MSWKFVFDTNNAFHCGDELEDIVKIVHKMRYKFCTFNDRVLFVDTTGKSHETGLTVDDLY